MDRPCNLSYIDNNRGGFSDCKLHFQRKRMDSHNDAVYMLKCQDSPHRQCIRTVRIQYMDHQCGQASKCIVRGGFLLDIWRLYRKLHLHMMVDIP